jgi:DNA-binding MarR family transcriptional regulator
MRISSAPPIGLLIGIARRKIVQALSALLEASKTTPQQFWVMLLLEERAVTTVLDVSRQIGIDGPAASRLVDRLNRRGWVRLDRDHADGRRLRVELTAPGRRQATDFRKFAMRMSAAIELGLTRTEKNVVAAALRRVIGNLDSVERGGGAPSRSSPRRRIPRRRR